jgi:hypothetical protein
LTNTTKQLAGYSSIPKRAIKHDLLHLIQEVRLLTRTNIFLILASILFLIDFDGVQQKGEYNWLNLILLQPFCALFIETWYQLYKARQLVNTSPFMANLELMYLEIEADPASKKEFRDHLDAEMSTETYMFLDAVEFFQYSYRANNSLETAKLAQDIFSTYIHFG